MDNSLDGIWKRHPRYLDRDFSWLAFNRRVLGEAFDDANPLLERLKFLAIVAGNLDEFFEIRVASLLQKVESGVGPNGIAAMDCPEKLVGLLEIAHAMVESQYRCWNEEIIPLLSQSGVLVKCLSDLDGPEKSDLYDRFRKDIHPLLTPIKVDPAHPFPWVLNKALCIGVWLEEEGADGGGLGVLTIPRSLPRVLALPGAEHRYVFLYDVIKLFLEDLFRGYRIVSAACFRVTRNSNLYLDEDEEEGNLIDTVEAEVHNRRKGNAVRLEIDSGTFAPIREALLETFDLEPGLVFAVPGPLNLNRLMGLYQMIPLNALKFPPHIPRNPLRGEGSPPIFDRLRFQDLLLHHPFDSFEPVADFIQAAARDPDVLCIKHTLYRTSDESPIMYSLLEAAERGKEVVAVVELQARFDEQSNIQWARQLQDKGGTVVYGLVGLKTHCKLALALRREGDRIREYVHVGTGNYHPETAKHYTDLSLLTADRAIVEQVSDVFHYLTSHARDPKFPSLLVGPVNFLSETLRLIGEEEKNAIAGRPCGITAKMNAVIDPDVIEALYRASQAGVSIRLVVRGICALRPGIPGLSENIEVRSVVGRFLEHSRVFRFENAGSPLLYMGSGDWMTRNLRERVETLVPVDNPALRRRLENILSVYWADNAKSHAMREDGSYVKLAPAPGQPLREAQTLFLGHGEALPDAGLDLFPDSPLAENKPRR